MAVLLFAILGSGLGILLGIASRVYVVPSNPLVDSIEALMPGGQCGQCGKAGCRQAAEAMVKGELKPDECPPGGAGLAASISKILGVSAASNLTPKSYLAVIDEATCTGCTRCYKACPFDSIVGANKQIHSVIKEICTGCRLCVDSCPDNCIGIYEVEPEPSNWIWPKPAQLRS
ncbi:RnfABCDGE type electron transport complex subunit B [Vibrio sp. FNV 38]|nr:RnfABCDGE type electron transport complex subunit B [Vibrio sp. FNV 38]